MKNERVTLHRAADATLRANISDRELLRLCRDWFRASEGAEGADWLNGQSDKYQGDGWEHAEALLAALDRRAPRDGANRYEKPRRRR